MSAQVKRLSETSSLKNSFINLIEELANNLLEEFDLSGGEVSIVFADDDMLRGLNRDYRGKDVSTDVLSFSYLQSDDELLAEQEEFPVGDIYISVDRAIEQAEETRHSLERELATLVIHGLLHLLGFEHNSDNDTAKMQEKEISLLARYDQKVDRGV